MTPIEQFRTFIVRPVLKHLGLHSVAAEDLVLGTAAYESGRLKFFEQVVGTSDAKLGPALGFFQIEPQSHAELWQRFLLRNPQLARKVTTFVAEAPSRDEQLLNPFYGAAICRVLYYQHKEPLPAAGDIEGYAAYWKKYYNTRLGKGKPENWAATYRAVCNS